MYGEYNWYCYAAPAHQIQEVYVGSEEPPLRHSGVHGSDAGYFFANEIHKVPALTIAGQYP